LCEKILAIDNINPSVHYLLSLILREQDKEEEAIRALNRSVYLDQNFAVAYFTLGNLLLRKGNAGKAQKCFKNARSALATCKYDDIVPESDGLSAGRLTEIIDSVLSDNHLLK
jgi:chemotaxis protein methyltransferase CheR